ncbi:hypothetical protein D3C86_2248070 [compost metagenome]
MIGIILGKVMRQRVISNLMPPDKLLETSEVKENVAKEIAIQRRMKTLRELILE